MPRDPRDKLDIAGLGTKNTGERSTGGKGPRTRFLSVMFRCCNNYGRLYMNDEQTRYEGRCPSCGARTSAVIGPGGTDKRIFETD